MKDYATPLTSDLLNYTVPDTTREENRTAPITMITAAVTTVVLVLWCSVCYFTVVQATL